MIISQIRKNAGYSTQEQLAAHTGVSRSTIAKLEVGIAVPKWSTLKRIAEALNITTDHLMSEYRPNETTT